MERAFELEKFLTAENHVRSNFYSDTFRAKFGVGGKMGEWDITYIRIPFTPEKEEEAMRRFGLRKEDMDTFYHRLLRCIKNDLDIYRYVVNALNRDEEQETGSLRRSCVMYIHDNGRMRKDDEGREIREIVRVSRPYRSLWDSGYAEKDGTIRLSKVLELQIRTLQIIRQLNLIGVHLGAIDLDAILVAEDSDPDRPTLALGSFMYAYRDDTQQIQNYPACTPKNIFPSLLDSKELAPTYDTDLFSWAALSCSLMTGGWWNKMPDLSVYPAYMPEDLLDATWNGFGFEAEKYLQPINKEYNRYWRLVRKEPDKDKKIPISLEPETVMKPEAPLANTQEPAMPVNVPEDVSGFVEAEKHAEEPPVPPIACVNALVPDEPEPIAPEAFEQEAAEEPVQTPKAEEAAPDAQGVEAEAANIEPAFEPQPEEMNDPPAADTQEEVQGACTQPESVQESLQEDEESPSEQSVMELHLIELDQEEDPKNAEHEETYQPAEQKDRPEEPEESFAFEAVSLDDDLSEQYPVDDEAETAKEIGEDAVLHQGWCGDEKPPFQPADETPDAPVSEVSEEPKEPADDNDSEVCEEPQHENMDPECSDVAEEAQEPTEQELRVDEQHEDLESAESAASEPEEVCTDAEQEPAAEEALEPIPEPVNVPAHTDDESCVKEPRNERCGFALDPAMEAAAKAISAQHLPFMAFCPEGEEERNTFIRQMLWIMGEGYIVAGDGPMRTFLYMGVEGHPMPAPSCEMHEDKEVNPYEEKPCEETPEDNAEADERCSETGEAYAADVPQDPSVDEVMAPCEDMLETDAEERGDPYIGCNGRWWNGDIDTGVEAISDARYESQLPDVSAPDASDAQEVEPVGKEEESVIEPAVKDVVEPESPTLDDPADECECGEVDSGEAADDLTAHSDNVAPEDERQATEGSETVAETVTGDVVNVDANIWDPFAFVAPGTGDIEIPAFEEPEQPEEKHESEIVSKDPFAFIDEDSFFCFTQVNLQ